jgi:hypothetical protein
VSDKSSGGSSSVALPGLSDAVSAALKTIERKTIVLRKFIA